MTSFSAASLSAELYKLLEILEHIRDIDRRNPSSALTDEEKCTVAELGKCLASYHKYGTPEFDPAPVSDREEFISWLRGHCSHIVTDYLCLFPLIDIVFQYFRDGEKVAPSRYRLSGWEIAHNEYQYALECKRASAVFDSFLSDTLPALYPTPHWWDEIVQRQGMFNDIRRHRIITAVDDLQATIKSQSSDSPLYNFYLDLGPQARDLISPGEKLHVNRETFDKSFDALIRHRDWLANCDPNVNIVLDGDALRTIKTQVVPPSEFPALNTQDGTWIRADSEDMKSHGTENTLRQRRKRGIRLPEGCEKGNCMLGKDQTGVWRRAESGKRIIWYLKSSLEND